MILGGLVSVTFRQLSVDEIIELVNKTNLKAIEWGGDVHVPHGDIQRATATRDKCSEAGITIASYGSYYRVGHNEPVPYENILATAVALGAPLIRVWAGKLNAEDADSVYWQKVVSDSRRIAALTASKGLKVAFEYHENTLTNTLNSTLKLLKDIEHDDMTTYWQAPSSTNVDQNIRALSALLPWLSYIHVNTGRMPLGDPNATNNSIAWQKYLNRVVVSKRDHYALIEFAKDDDPAQFELDAGILYAWLNSANS